jgi:phosphohistidine phosphatase
MKTLLLLRHAKSSKNDPALHDFDRPLNARGLEAAELIGQTMQKQQIEPELIVSSPAQRARQTAEIAIVAGKLTGELRFDQRIYEASVKRLLEVVSQIEDRFGSVMLVGHNPGFEELLETLIGEAREMPTASLTRIGLPVEKWTDVQPGSGTLGWLIEPKKIKQDS